MKMLMVLSSHADLGETGAKTGFWLEEFAAPYYVFKDANAQISLASPRGGRPPIDPKSATPESRTKATRRFMEDVDAHTRLAKTLKLKSLDAKNFDAVFYVGGHGPLWDLVQDPDSIALLEAMFTAQKPVAAVCHAPAVLLQLKNASGNFILSDKKVTGFSNAEELAAGLTNVVPFLLEDSLKQKGATYTKVGNGQPYVITDGTLVTGQNSASSEATACALLTALTFKSAAKSLETSKISATARLQAPKKTRRFA